MRLTWSFWMPESFWDTISLIADSTPAVITYHSRIQKRIKCPNHSLTSKSTNKKQIKTISQKQNWNSIKKCKKDEVKIKPLFLMDASEAAAYTVADSSWQLNPCWIYLFQWILKEKTGSLLKLKSPAESAVRVYKNMVWWRLPKYQKWVFIKGPHGVRRGQTSHIFPWKS